MQRQLDVLSNLSSFGTPGPLEGREDVRRELYLAAKKGVGCGGGSEPHLLGSLAGLEPLRLSFRFSPGLTEDPARLGKRRHRIGPKPRISLSSSLHE